jgi:MYXO-CTERM domain-containing protein
MKIVIFVLLALVTPRLARAQLAAGEPAAQFELTDWVAGVPNATDIAFLPDGRAVVTLKSGEVALVGRDGVVLMPMAARFQVDNGDETGLLGVVSDGATLYFYATTGSDYADKHRVYRATVGATGPITVDLANPVVTGGLAGSSNHVGGGMVIHKGQLYIGVGDAGFNRTPPVNQQAACLNKANGKILRVNLDGTVPADNPLTGLAAVTSCEVPDQGSFSMAAPDKRIFAWGLRNPWRFWIDPDTSLLWIGDVGEQAQEEITVGGKGANHGWPFNEGTVKYASVGGLMDCRQMVPPTDCVAPQDTYPHGSGDASVTGGLVPPSGCGWAGYERRYFFGDYVLDTVWTLDLKPDRTGAVAGSRKPFAMVPNPVSFRMGPDNALYVVSHEGGAVRRIAPRGLRPTCQAATVPDAGVAGGDAGTGGAGGAGGSGGGGSPADARPAPDAARDASVSSDAPAAGGKSSGCSCQVPGDPPPAAVPVLAALALTILSLRPRKRR